jgi:quercetin dioxygenase-like cupin family protein
MGGNGGAPPMFFVRAVSIAPGSARAFDEAEWRDAVVSLACGEVELECLGGSTQRIRRGDVLWLSGLPVRALRNPGEEPAVLIAVSRRLLSGARSF